MNCAVVMARAILPFAFSNGRMVISQKCAMAVFIISSLGESRAHLMKFPTSCGIRSGATPWKVNVLFSEIVRLTMPVFVRKFCLGFSEMSL